MADIDVGQLSEAINDKMDRDMGNQNTGIHHIIETYVDGTSGYRIWDDGYCEQWGYYSSSSTWETITLLKTYDSTNYNLTFSCLNGSYSDGCKIVSSNTIQIYQNVPHCWKTGGYLADGEY